MDSKQPINVAYIQGRPGPHPMHRKFAERVNADLHFVDFKMRWQDKNRSIFYRAISSIVCAFSFPNKKNYNLFLVDNLHFMPVIMKMFRLIRQDQKIVAHLGSHTLYFLYAHRFSKFNEWLHKQALKRYDALICEGKMAEDLVKKILGPDHPKLYYVYMGIPKEHFPDTSKIKTDLNTKNILFVGHGPGKDRAWYKGLDLMIEGFQFALEKDPELTFTIVGDWDKEVIADQLKDKSEKIKAAIQFNGPTKDLGKYTSTASLYLHCARGEAYGITIMIAMASGLPTLVSEWTGAKEIVEKVDQRLIVPIEPRAIAEKIQWYFSLSATEKEGLSLKGKEAVKDHTEENAIAYFKSTFDRLTNDLNL